MNKAQKLEAVADSIRDCSACKLGTHGLPVPGEGNPDASFVFIGEAPGKTEAQTGRPFIGRSGKYLRTLIRESGLSEDDVYITSPVKYLPDSGTPTDEQIRHGKTHLDKQLDIIDPRVVVLLGSVACRGVLGEAHQVLKEHGSILRKNGRSYLITLHPAAILRFTKYRELMEDDFRKLSGLKK